MPDNVIPLRKTELEEDTAKLQFFRHTDTGNAKRLALRYGDTLRYCHSLRQWFVWNQAFWFPDTENIVMQMAKETVDTLFVVASSITDEEARKQLRTHALRSESTARLKSMVENAQSEDELMVSPKQLDRDEWLLGVPNGAVDLKTGELVRPDPSWYITKQCAVPYAPGFKDQRWNDFLRTVCNGDRELAFFLQRAAYATLIGLPLDKAFMFVFGPPNTGKSTFVETLARMLGTYAGLVDYEAFLKRSYVGGIRADLADMDGKRMVRSTEMGDGKLNEELLKLLTGDGVVKFERKYANPWTAMVTFTIWFSGNKIPKALAESTALWNRWRQVPFVHDFPDPDDKIMQELLHDEDWLKAALAWAVRGRSRWEAKGIGTAPAVERATAEARDSMDPLHKFVEDWCETGPAYWIETSDLRTHYEEWCVQNHRKPISQDNYDSLLTGRKFKAGQKKRSGKKHRVRLGIRVKAYRSMQGTLQE